MGLFIFLSITGTASGLIVLIFCIDILIRKNNVNIQKNNQARYNVKGERDKDISETSKYAIAADLNAIVNQLRVQNEQARHADKGAKFREWVNIVVLSFTLFALMVSACLLGYQIIDARSMADRQHEDTVTALVSAQRAFVYGFLNHSLIIEPSTHVPTGISFTYVWRNSGETPTRNMTNEINIMILDDRPAANWDFPDIVNDNADPEYATLVQFSVAPKDATASLPLLKSISELKPVVEGKKFLYMWGWAKYNDVFPDTKTHITRFAERIEIAWDIPTGTTAFLYPSLMPKYNCSDDECERQGVGESWTPRRATVATIQKSIKP